MQQWISDLFQEYNEVFAPGQTPDPNTFWGELHAQKINVLFLHPGLLSEEVENLVISEMANLIGTFLLMIAFLAGAISFRADWSVDPSRILISMLCVVQPVLACGMAFGLGQIDMWTMCVSDLDADGEEDHQIVITLLTPFCMHLMLAVVVDYDIIMVRSFDRVNSNLTFEDRLE